MPNQDGTGPTGQGPMTGKGLGSCRFNMPFFGRCFGRGFGKGMGMRRGFGRFFNWPSDSKDQKELLSDYKKALEEELEDVDQALTKIKDE